VNNISGGLMSFNIAASLINALLQRYIVNISKFYSIFPNNLPGLDHFAIVELNSVNSGITHLQKIFEIIGFCKRGEGYLPEKINDFIWMLHDNNAGVDPASMIPQVILADFRADMLSKKNRNIVDKYAKYYPNINFSYLEKAVASNEMEQEVVQYLFNHMNCRFWPLPTYKEYMSLKEENELMAWVLLFGRVVNHFGVCIYTTGEYDSLADFNDKARRLYNIGLNNVEGEIKGSKKIGLEQSSSVGSVTYFDLDGGTVEVNDAFLEFVWRHPVKDCNTTPKIFDDFYQDFLPSNANNIVESVYEKQLIKRFRV
jgi:hypothetical protein